METEDKTGARNNSYLTIDFYNALEAPHTLDETFMCAFTHL